MNMTPAFLIEEIRKTRRVYPDPDVVATIQIPEMEIDPNGAENFLLGRGVANTDLVAALRNEGRVIEDPYTFLLYVQDNPECADETPLAVQWGKQYYIVVYRSGGDGERELCVSSETDGWSKDYRFRVRTLPKL